MSKLISFYKRVLSSLGIQTDEQDFVVVDTGKKIQPMLIDGKPVVLPTKQHIDTMTTVESNGEVKINKVLFNPLREDLIKGETEVLIKLKKNYEIRINFAVCNLVELYIRFGMDQELQKKASLEASTFLTSLNVTRNRNVTNAIDAGTIEKWGKIYAGLLKAPSTKGAVHLFSKKAGKLNNVTYSKLVTATFPLYEALCNLKKDETIFDVKLRNKDIDVLKVIFKYIFNNIDTPEYYMIGSSDASSSFVSLTKMYIKIMSRINELISTLNFIDPEVIPTYITELEVDMNELDNLAMYDADLAKIPNDIDMGRNSATNKILSQTSQSNVTGTPSEFKLDLKALAQGYTMDMQKKMYEESIKSPSTKPVVSPINTVNQHMTPEQKLLYGNTPNFNTGKPMSYADINPMSVMSPYTGINMQQQTMPMYGSAMPYNGINVNPSGFNNYNPMNQMQERPYINIPGN